MEERTSTSIVSVFPDPLVITQSKNSNIFESKLNLTITLSHNLNCRIDRDILC